MSKINYHKLYGGSHIKYLQCGTTIQKGVKLVDNNDGCKSIIYNEKMKCNKKGNQTISIEYGDKKYFRATSKQRKNECKKEKCNKFFDFRKCFITQNIESIILNFDKKKCSIDDKTNNQKLLENILQILDEIGKTTNNELNNYNDIIYNLSLINDNQIDNILIFISYLNTTKISLKINKITQKQSYLKIKQTIQTIYDSIKNQLCQIITNENNKFETDIINLKNIISTTKTNIILKKAEYAIIGAKQAIIQIKENIDSELKDIIDNSVKLKNLFNNLFQKDFEVKELDNFINILKETFLKKRKEKREITKKEEICKKLLEGIKIKYKLEDKLKDNVK